MHGAFLGRDGLLGRLIRKWMETDYVEILLSCCQFEPGHCLDEGV